MCLHLSLATNNSSLFQISFVGRLFRHALEELRPPSVLINSLSVCISLLDPRRLTTGTAYAYNRQLTRGPTVSATMETVEGMLESLGIVLAIGLC